jgi:hypothetical protein
VALNCTPNSLALVVRPACTHDCVAKLIGCPVQLGERYHPEGLLSALLEHAEGPMWQLRETHRCPIGLPACKGLSTMPDRCLRPMDPDTEPSFGEIMHALVDDAFDALRGP